jgi:hypothetical protein
VNGDWKVFRPAIWLGILGIAVLLVLNVFVGIALIGGAIGVGLRIQSGRRRAARGLPPARRQRRR